MLERFYKRIKRDGGIYFLSSIFSQIFLFASTILIMRSFSIEEFGKFSLFLELAALITLILDSGTKTFYMLSFDAKDKGFNSYYLKVQLLLIASATPFIFLLYYLFFSFDSVHGEKIILVGLIISAFSALFSPHYSYLIRMQKAKWVFVRDVLISFFRLLFSIVIIALSSHDVIYLTFAFVFIISFLVYLLDDKKYNSFVNVEFRKMLPFIMVTVCSFLYNKVDIFMLSSLGGYADVANYAGGYKFIYPMLFVAMVLHQVLMPILIEGEVTRKGLIKCAMIYFMIGLFFAFVSIFLFFLCNEYVFEHKYDDSISVVLILAPYLPLVFCYGVISNYLMTHNYQKIVINTSLILMFINVILNSFLIPVYGASGAAIATIICEIIILLIYFIFISNRVFCDEV